MEEIMIRAQSFGEARTLLSKRFYKVWIPIRVWESNVFRFVDIIDIEPQQKDINYIKAQNKYESTKNNNNLLKN